MKRSLGVLLAATLFAVGCGRAGQSPESPSPVSPIAAGGSAAAGLVVPWSTFSADGARQTGIFSGTVDAHRFRPLAQLGPGPQAVGEPGAPAMLPPSVSGSTVTLNWSPPISGDFPTSYTIEAGSSSGGSNLANFDTGNTVTTLTAFAVPAGAYYVRVRGRNPAGLGTASNEVVVVVEAAPCTTPAAPSALLAIVTGSTVALAWNGVTGATTYVIEAGSAPGLSNLANFDTASSASSLTAFNVADGFYYVRVRSHNACGTSGASNEVLLAVTAVGPVLAGQWLGLAPDGIFVPTAVCEKEFDLLLDLTQSGRALTGTGTFRVRVSQGGTGCAQVGDIISNPLTGAVGADGSIAVRIPAPGGFADLSGNVAGSRMSGAITFSVNGLAYSGAWSVNRR